MNEEREAETSERHPTKGRGVKAKMTRPNGRRHNRLACQSHVLSSLHSLLSSRSFLPHLATLVPYGGRETEEHGQREEQSVVRKRDGWERDETGHGQNTQPRPVP